MKTLREMMDIVEGRVDVGRISHEIIPQKGGRYQVVIKRGDSVAHTSLHNSEEDAKKSLASQIAFTKKQQGIKEDHIDQDAAEPLAKHFADLYYNGLSSGDEAKLVQAIYDKIQSGEMSIGQLKADIAKLEKEKGIKETTGGDQEYTVRVVDEEGSGYTVKVTAPTEQGALHKAIVQVRRKYGAYPEHARIIRQDVEEQASPDAIARIEKLASDK